MSQSPFIVASQSPGKCWYLLFNILNEQFQIPKLVHSTMSRHKYIRRHKYIDKSIDNKLHNSEGNKYSDNVNRKQNIYKNVLM